VEIIKVYKQEAESLKFIGKKYNNANRLDGTFSVKSKWNEWIKNGWFQILEKHINIQSNHSYEDINAHIGLLRNKSGEPFQYWIGMFTSKNTELPEGFDYIDFPKSELGVCWVYGNKNDIAMNEGLEIFNQCKEKLENEGINHLHDKNDICLAFERYVTPRSIIQDDKGNIILDICFFINFYY